MKNLSPLSIFNISLPKGTSELIEWRRFQSTKLDSELHFGDAYRNQSMGAVAGDFDGDGCIADRFGTTTYASRATNRLAG